MISPYGRVKAQIRTVSGTNRDTVWTWNAIGKRRGAWGLDKDAPEATRGFLLNHVISELLPPNPDGLRYANSDPVTGQAAWYDLRVRIEKCLPAETGMTEPQFEPLPNPPGAPTAAGVLRYGAHPKSTGRTDGRTEHLEFLGNRQEIAERVSGVRDGHGNALADQEDQ